MHWYQWEGRASFGKDGKEDVIWAQMSGAGNSGAPARGSARPRAPAIRKQRSLTFELGVPQDIPLSPCLCRLLNAGSLNNPCDGSGGSAPAKGGQRGVVHRESSRHQRTISYFYVAVGQTRLTMVRNVEGCIYNIYEAAVRHSGQAARQPLPLRRCRRWV